MLKSVLADYLKRVTEREFDMPFMALLPSLGFYDIHYTHGQVEFGKDFIAKRIDDGVEIQYSFQSKAGNINQADWRDKIMMQMLEGVLNSLSHPQFDIQLPHQSVLVTTGRLKGNAALSLQDINNRMIVGKLGARAIIVWEGEYLIESLAKYGLEGVHQTTAAGLLGFARFYLLYSKALQSEVTDRDIEIFSRYWIDENLDFRKRILRSSIEAEIIANRLINDGLIYEAIYAYYGVMRVALHVLYDKEDDFLKEIYQQTVQKISALSKSFYTDLKSDWIGASKNLLRIEGASATMITYLVLCARIIEVLGLHYFLEEDEKSKDEVISFLRDFITNEPGCGHIPSERYTVSLVLAILAFSDAGRADMVRDLIIRSTIWLCDRHELGMGLAPLEADEYTEVTTLLGYPFGFIPVHQFGDSFLASALCDLAAFTDDKELYGDVVNDIRASKIFPIYWQPPDTKGVLSIESPDVVVYPNSQYSNHLTSFSLYEFAEHIQHEPRAFRIVEVGGSTCLLLLALMLRDRYFPTMWSTITERNHHPQ